MAIQIPISLMPSSHPPTCIQPRPTLDQSLLLSLLYCLHTLLLAPRSVGPSSHNVASRAGRLARVPRRALVLAVPAGAGRGVGDRGAVPGGAVPVPAERRRRPGTAEAPPRAGPGRGDQCHHQRNVLARAVQRHWTRRRRRQQQQQQRQRHWGVLR